MKAEKAVLILFLVSLLLKIFYLPYANFLLLGSSMANTVINFPFSFYFYSDKVLNNQNYIISTICGFFLAIISLGILFTAMNWYGGKLYLQIGLITGFTILLILYFIKDKLIKISKRYYLNMLLRVFIHLLLAIVFISLG